MSGSDALALLDYPAYFDLLKLPLPEDRAALLARLEEDRLLALNAAGNWDVTNLGAILFAKDLHRFRGLARKAVRVVVYEGKGRIKTLREQEGKKGYACGFSGLMDYINALLPRNEVIGQALRREVPMYPNLAVRELVANALIHQISLSPAPARWWRCLRTGWKSPTPVCRWSIRNDFWTARRVHATSSWHRSCAVSAFVRSEAVA